MKYSTFIKLVKELGFDTHDYGHLLAVEGDNRDNIFLVSKTVEYSLNSNLIAFKRLSKDQRKALFNLATELASTPLEEREDEKRYRLIIPFVRDSVKYLTVRKTTGDLTVSYLAPYYEDYQSEFTETEIKALKEKHNLDSFVMEEVLANE